ncbi:hypothetical protein L2W58_11445 [Dethiosulfovibrio sp. F2B]|uniref:hypothetical protein n=1 Tax=Dethiosulfovibrio faecalis TaxID=2720018 RepID=UPI001F2050E4|nr:hypothetical protein [Dethiosulfovibrio faecalis]MCF4152410.1 hypothetical protein [Dethiosulfovibrio faecalis]
MSRFLRVVLIVVTVLICGILIADMAMDVMVQNETSLAAESQELQGIQGADETNMVVQKTKMKKSGAAGKKAARSMDKIHKDKLAQYTVINGALQTQKDLYGAHREGLDSQVASLSAKLKKEIPQAKGALKKLRALTDEEVALIKSTTKDAQAIKGSEACYASWRSAVDSLKDQPLTANELKARNEGIRKNSDVAIENAHSQAKSIKSEDLAKEDKALLKKNVVGGAKNVFSGMESIMGNMQSVMQGLIGQMQKGGMPNMDASSLQGLQGIFEGIGKQMQGFMKGFGPFAQTVGGLVGEKVSVPSLSIPDFGGMIGGMSGGGGGITLPIGGIKIKSPF